MNALKGDRRPILSVFGQKQAAKAVFVFLPTVMNLLEALKAGVVLPVQILIHLAALLGVQTAATLRQPA